MDKTNEALFKQAINEALTNKFQRMADACDEEIVCSRRHRKAMRGVEITIGASTLTKRNMYIYASHNACKDTNKRAK